MQFQDELPQARTTRAEPIDWEQAKADLVANEGKWGLIATSVAQSTPQQLRKGGNRHFRGDELKHFEFAARRPKNPANPEDYPGNRTDLWGRYTK